jgi:hypothetical protein
MADPDGPIVAGTFYHELFKRSANDPGSAAYALHVAVKQLRARRVSAARWATFIHTGV